MLWLQGPPSLCVICCEIISLCRTISPSCHAIIIAQAPQVVAQLLLSSHKPLKLSWDWSPLLHKLLELSHKLPLSFEPSGLCTGAFCHCASPILCSYTCFHRASPSCLCVSISLVLITATVMPCPIRRIPPIVKLPTTYLDTAICAIILLPWCSPYQHDLEEPFRLPSPPPD